MCCRTVVTPLNEEIARALLTIGQFKPVGTPEHAMTWQREIPEEGATVWATIKTVDNSLELSIGPAISAYEHHAMKRLAAGVYFEIAAKYAEKVSGIVTQRATVAGCRTDAGYGSDLMLAAYPNMPLSFERVCRGFQELFLHDHD